MQPLPPDGGLGQGASPTTQRPQAAARRRRKGRHGTELLRGWAALVGAVFVEDLTDFTGFWIVTERFEYSSG